MTTLFFVKKYNVAVCLLILNCMSSYVFKATAPSHDICMLRILKKSFSLIFAEFNDGRKIAAHLMYELLNECRFIAIANLKLHREFAMHRR